MSSSRKPYGYVRDLRIAIAKGELIIEMNNSIDCSFYHNNVEIKDEGILSQLETSAEKPLEIRVCEGVPNETEGRETGW